MVYQKRNPRKKLKRRNKKPNEYILLGVEVC